MGGDRSFDLGGTALDAVELSACVLDSLRDDAERVMKRNFPDSKYLKGEAGKSGSWWRIWNW